jgi:hypothetical protein
MTNTDKIKTIDVRISLLKTRGEAMNANIIHKLERKKRALART